VAEAIFAFRLEWSFMHLAQRISNDYNAPALLRVAGLSKQYGIRDFAPKSLSC